MDNIDKEELLELLNIYHSTDDNKIKTGIKSKIVGIMNPVVKKIARTIARREYDPIEDLSQAGFIGLLKAIDNYDKNKNDNFRVYAGYLIIGEMKHYLRDKMDTIRVPRHVQELMIRINSFTQNLTPEELSCLTSEDVAAALQISTKEVDFVMQVDRRRTTYSLDEIYTSDNDSLGYEEVIASSNYKEKADIFDAKIMFNEVIDILPPDERIMIEMYYNQDMTQKEIAKNLELSEMKVSRDLKHAFDTIYEYFEGNKTSKSSSI